MNEREISEIRRRMRPEKNNIGRIRGCYVNEKHAVISYFDQTLGLISNDESEEILSILRKVYSGSVGKNLIDISFSNDQVLNSREHSLLSSLRSTALKDDTVVQTFFEKAAASIEIEGSYFILLASDAYDIFTYNEFGEKNESPEIFSYIVCAVCPIKSARPSLSYSLSERKFKNFVNDTILSAPEIGFMFPAFDDRCANIYNALFYTRDISVSHESFIDSIFKTKTPMPASEQTESIAEILSKTIPEDCDLELVKIIQDQIIELTEDHKINKNDEPLIMTAKDIGTLLRCGGVGEDDINSFTEKFEADFGDDASIAPANILNIKKFEVRTPEVSVKVAPSHSDLVQTRIIDGTKYILIRADNDIEVNGIKINVND